MWVEGRLWSLGLPAMPFAEFRGFFELRGSGGFSRSGPIAALRGFIFFWGGILGSMVLDSRFRV